MSTRKLGVSKFVFLIFLFIPFFVAYAFHVKSLVVESVIQTSYQDDKIHVHRDIRVKKTLQDRKQKTLACQNEISGVWRQEYFSLAATYYFFFFVCVCVCDFDLRRLLSEVKWW